MAKYKLELWNPLIYAKNNSKKV